MSGKRQRECIKKKKSVGLWKQTKVRRHKYWKGIIKTLFPGGLVMLLKEPMKNINSIKSSWVVA